MVVENIRRTDRITEVFVECAMSFSINWINLKMTLVS